MRARSQGPKVRAAHVLGPVSRRSAPENVLDVEACAAFDEEPNHVEVTVGDGLVQRGAVGMAAGRVVAVEILSCVEELPGNLHVAELGGEGERQVTVL